MFFFFAFCTFFKIFHVRLGKKSKSVSFSRVYVCVKAKLTVVSFFYFFLFCTFPLGVIAVAGRKSLVFFFSFNLTTTSDCIGNGDLKESSQRCVHNQKHPNISPRPHCLPFCRTQYSLLIIFTLWNPKATQSSKRMPIYIRVIQFYLLITCASWILAKSNYSVNKIGFTK